MNDFFRTPMGNKFYQGDVPRIADSLEKIAKQLERLNGNLENRSAYNGKQDFKDWFADVQHEAKEQGIAIESLSSLTTLIASMYNCNYDPKVAAIEIKSKFVEDTKIDT
jgi:hypothetical protein